MAKDLIKALTVPGKSQMTLLKWLVNLSQKYVFQRRAGWYECIIKQGKSTMGG